MKKIIIVLLLISFSLSSCSKKQQQKYTKPTVQVTLPKFKDVPLYISVPGHIEAFKHVEVRPQVSGLITKIAYQEGQRVNEGDLLVEIDQRPFIANLQKNEGILLENRAKLQFDEDTLTRNIPLVKDDYISQNAFENLAKNVEVSQAMIAQNLAEIETAKINLEYCTITSPISGIAGNKLIDLGNLVVKDSSDSTLVTINQITPIYANFYIPEKDLHQVIMARHESNDPLKVLVSYDEDFSKPFEGTLDLINNQVDEKTGMILLKGIFTNKDEILWPGQYVNVRLILKQLKNAMLIPSQAVQRNDKGPYVYTINGGKKVEIKQIKLGQLQGNYFVVEKGLKEDEAIVIKGQLNLFPNAEVNIENKEDMNG